MKVLLDENIQPRMQEFLRGDFEVFTLKDLGWLGYKNGVLRELLNENNFDFLVTTDKKMPFQQNLNKVNFTILLLDSPASAWAFHSKLVPRIIDFIHNVPSPRPKLVHIPSDGWDSLRLIEKLKSHISPDQLLFI